mgnify:CR=1 FL=1
MINAKELSEEQVGPIRAWAESGEGLSGIQRMLAAHRTSLSSAVPRTARPSPGQRGQLGTSEASVLRRAGGSAEARDSVSSWSESAWP